VGFVPAPLLARYVLFSSLSVSSFCSLSLLSPCPLFFLPSSLLAFLSSSCPLPPFLLPFSLLLSLLSPSCSLLCLRFAMWLLSYMLTVLYSFSASTLFHVLYLLFVLFYVLYVSCPVSPLLLALLADWLMTMMCNSYILINTSCAVYTHRISAPPFLPSNQCLYTESYYVCKDPPTINNIVGSEQKGANSL
jgi:hypothetical protein